MQFKKLKRRNIKGSFTLVELIMTIVIAGVILIPTSLVIYESVQGVFLPEYFTVGSGLLQTQTERVSNLRFSEVVNEGPVAFGSSFSDYSYQVSFYYVSGSDLETDVSPAVTDYRRVEIAVYRLGFPALTATTLITNN